MHAELPGVNDVSTSRFRTWLRGCVVGLGMSPVRMPLIAFDPETEAETPTGKFVELGEFRWMAASPIYRYGNDGPVFDRRQHVSNPCQTFNADAHQRFTLDPSQARSTGCHLATWLPFRKFRISTRMHLAGSSTTGSASST